MWIRQAHALANHHCKRNRTNQITNWNEQEIEIEIHEAILIIYYLHRLISEQDMHSLASRPSFPALNQVPLKTLFDY